MTGSVLLLVSLAGLLGAALGSAAGSPARSWFVGLVAALTALEVFVARSALERSDPDAYRRFRRVEFWLLVLGVRLAQAVTGGAGGFLNPTAGNRETVVALALVVATRASVNATIEDLDAIDRALHRADGTDPVARIRGRIIGYAVVVALATAFAAVGLGGLFDLTRMPQRNMALTPVVFLVLALPGLAYAVLRAEQGRWRRDGATVDGSVTTVWIRRSIALSALVVLVGLLVWNAAGVSGLGAAGIVRSGPVGEWIVERLAAIGSFQSNAPPERGEGEVIDPASELDLDRNSTPDWLGEAMLWAIAATVIWWAATYGRRAAWERRQRSGRDPGLSLRQVLVEIWRVLVDLVQGLWRMVRGIRGQANGLRPGTTRSAVDRTNRWMPGDPFRERIARSYRRAGRTVASASGLRRAAETPREYAVRVGRDQPQQASDVSDLTHSYEEARFSAHPLTEGHARGAEDAADRVERRSNEV